jgi:hypothetical protein
MTRPIHFFKAIAKRPMEAIESIVALILFLTGLWFLTPWYQPNPGASSSLKIVDGITLAMLFGTIQVLMAGPMLYALLRERWPRRQQIRRIVTFTSFILLTFYGFSGVILFGTQRLSWLQTFGLALISAVCHLRLKWEMDTQDAGN